MKLNVGVFDTKMWFICPRNCCRNNCHTVPSSQKTGLTVVKIFFEKICFGPSRYPLNTEGGEGTENWRDAKGTNGSDECRKQETPRVYLGIQEDLEFGGGVATLSPDLRFRNLLKNAT